MSRNEDGERTTSLPELDRRTFLAVGGAVTTTLVAGCTGGGSGGPDSGTSTAASGGSDGAGESTGTFQLYISDKPVAIDEFDSLDVTVDGARLFRGEESADEADATTTATTTDAKTTATPQTPSTTGAETTTEGAGTATTETSDESGTTTAETNDESDTEPTETTEAPEPTETESTTAGSERAGVVDIAIDDRTVDLTTLPGKKATSVFAGAVPTGDYSSIHLSVSEVDGVVDGESVPVKLPSEKLKIVTPFTVAKDEPLEFVFDITVVEKGKSGGYNLLPVIGESGVVGNDVEVETVEQGTPAETGTADTTTEQS